MKDNIEIGKTSEYRYLTGINDVSIKYTDDL